MRKKLVYAIIFSIAIMPGLFFMTYGLMELFYMLNEKILSFWFAFMGFTTNSLRICTANSLIWNILNIAGLLGIVFIFINVGGMNNEYDE